MKNNIILVGMPAAGKSTVGVILAKTIGYNFVDTDIVISNREGCTLQHLVDTLDYEGFLKVEEAAALSLDCEKTVIATGGSMVLCENAMKRLKNDSVVVFLDAPLDEIRRRLTNIKTRGIAFGPNNTLSDIYNLRMPLYKKYADHTVDVTQGTEKVVEEIIRKVFPQEDRR
ncbi:MAG: shikimate kinase [Clostridia bacterium]|nr:shikimate kinase [Clostridia bacterium]